MDPIIEAWRGVLPDCRAAEPKGQVQTPFGLATPVFCANCGKPGGYAIGCVEFMFYLCESCDRWGTGIELPVVDPKKVRDLAGGG